MKGKEHKNKWSVASRLLPSLVVLTLLPTAIFAINSTVVGKQKYPNLEQCEKPMEYTLSMKANKTIEIEQGDDFDVNKYVKATYGDTRLNVYVVGEEALQTIGDHTITVTATAENGSFIQKDIKITVKPKEEKPKEEKPEELKEVEKEPEKEETEKTEKSENNEVTEKPAETDKTTEKDTDKTTTGKKPEIIPVKPVEKPTEKPVDKPTDTPTVEVPKDSTITYYPEEKEPVIESGYYKTEEGCRADHPAGNCVPSVGADGKTVEGYVWIEK